MRRIVVGKDVVCHIMLPPISEVSIVDSLSTKHKFSVERIMLNCGLALIEIGVGEPSF